MKTPQEIVRILHNTDPQKAFTQGIGLNPVPNAKDAFEPMQNVINNEIYNMTITTFDTHTKEQYEGSFEQSIFKDIHCEFGTDGWKIDTIRTKSYEKFIAFVSTLKEPFSLKEIGNDVYVTKCEFDVWTNDEFVKYIEDNFNPENTIVDVIGFALNYCVFDAVKGYVERGYKVRIIQDAVKGITNTPDGGIDETFQNSLDWYNKNNIEFINSREV